jgi:hypothetical protein
MLVRISYRTGAGTYKTQGKPRKFNFAKAVIFFLRHYFLPFFLRQY